jgi:hypothetical protein
MVPVALSALLRVAEVAVLAEAQQVLALPWVQAVQLVALAQPSEARVAAAEVQLLAAQEVAAARPWAVPAEVEVQRAAEPAAEEVQRVGQAAAAVARPSVVRAVQPVAVAEQPSEARVAAVLPSAGPSVRSALPVARLAQRRLTMSRLRKSCLKTSRRKPGLATVELQRSQSSSEEGFECSSWSLWSEKKTVQPESCRPSQRSEMRSVDSD